MTVCSKPKSFKYGELERCASTSTCSNSASVNSACTYTSEYSNTTTTDEDVEDSSTSLSLLSLSSEEEDWKQFGYLLDLNEPRFDMDSTVPYHQQFCETPLLSRSNSSPATPESTPTHFKYDMPGSELEVSSLDVEVSSSAGSNSSESLAQCDRNANSIARADDDDEPVAKRTRHSLASIEAMRDSLARLSNVPKEEVIEKFLQSSPKVTRVHNVCRPWWHKKILHKSESADGDLSSMDEDENENNEKAFRRPKEYVEAPLGSRSANTEALNSETPSKQKVENTMKFESSPIKQEAVEPKFKENPMESIKSETLSPSSHSADDERSPTTRVGKNRKRLRPSPEKTKPKNSSSSSARSNTPTTAHKQNRRQQKAIKAENEDQILDTKKKHCFCGTPYDPKKFYLMCDHCRKWFHGKCVGITEKKAQKMDSWMCSDCEKDQAHHAKELYCVCRQPYDEKRFYVGCDACEDWFHPECINTTKEAVSKVDQFICPKCRGSTRSRR